MFVPFRLAPVDVSRSTICKHAGRYGDAYRPTGNVYNTNTRGTQRVITRVKPNRKNKPGRYVHIKLIQKSKIQPGSFYFQQWYLKKKDLCCFSPIFNFIKWSKTWSPHRNEHPQKLGHPSHLAPIPARILAAINRECVSGQWYRII